MRKLKVEIIFKTQRPIGNREIDLLEKGRRFTNGVGREEGGRRVK